VRDFRFMSRIIMSAELELYICKFDVV